MADDSGGPLGDLQLPVKLHLLPLVENPPSPTPLRDQLYFKNRCTAVMEKDFGNKARPPS